MTKRRPVDALANEQTSLNALPTSPYDDRELAYRLVSSYGYIDFDGNHYRAPAEVGAWVYVRADDKDVFIVAGPARVIARHPRGPRNAGEWIPEPVKHKRRRMSELLAVFEGWGTTALRYAQELQQRKRYAGAELAQIIEQRGTYSAEDILAAIEHASRYAAYGAQDIERILKARATPRTYEDHLAARARDQIRRAMADTPVRQRGLDAYARLLAAPAVTEDARCENHDGDEDEDPA